MKKHLLVLILVIFSFTTIATAQLVSSPATSTTQNSNPTRIVVPKAFRISRPASDFPRCDTPQEFDNKQVPRNGQYSSSEMSEKRKKKMAFLQSAGPSPTTIDPLMKMGPQPEGNYRGNRAPIANFEGIGLNVSPPDPSMAVGPNHVVTMENGLWAVYDKNGNIASGFPKNLTDPLSAPGSTSNAGDPVVMYDREADRWFISQFQLPNNNVFLIGISITPDPTGAYYVYEYELNQGNDYPHYGIWGDTYVAAGNFSGPEKVYTFNRSKMLAGDSTAEIAVFAPANLSVSGFAAPIPVHSEAAGAATGPIKIMYYQDNAFSGVNQDHIGLWNINMNWNNINSSTISGKIEIPTAAYDAIIAGTNGDSFANLQQPNTTQRIDAIVGAVMNMCHWYKFATHESILLNWVVELEEGSKKSGIRWVELRSTNNGASWSVYQEGTFTDPGGNTVATKESVFMGCMSMDKQGNIGLGYTKTGTSTFPSLYYTGRMANDPLGQMTVPETLVIAGTSSVTNNSRYGDYGQGVRDPNDDLTFWVTSEFSGSDNRRVRVYSFKLGTEFDNDVAITAINNPVTGADLSTTENVTVTISNIGNVAQSNIPVSLSLDGNVVATETFTGTIAPGATATYTFTATVDLSTFDQSYELQACTNLATDQANQNDCFSATVSNILATDLAITNILSPSGGVGLTSTEDLIFTLENLGANAESNIQFSFTLDNNAPVNFSLNGPVEAASQVNISLADIIDVAALGTHTICVQVNQPGDGNSSNNLFCNTFTTLSCVGTTQTGCNIDGIKQLIFEDINVDDGGSGCNTEPTDGPIGYANRTYLSTDVDRAAGQNTIAFQAQTNWNPEALSLWIDFNDNGVFEISERLLNSIPFETEDALSNFSVTIPTNANLGSHVMRLKAWDTSAAGDGSDPCADINYGETHDYTINVIDTSLDCESVTFFTGNSWSNGVPDDNKAAIINSNYNTATYGSFNACSLIITNNNTLTVSSEEYINITNNITVDGTLLIEHQGSVVQIENNATVTNNGNISVAMTTPPLNGRDFMIMGSPMTGESTSGVYDSFFKIRNHITANFVPDPIVENNSPQAGNWADDNGNDWLNYTGGLTPGEGYVVMPSGEQPSSPPYPTYTMTHTIGTLNNGIVTYSAGFNTDQNSSPNMVANPYPSAISAEEFINENSTIVDAVYFWEHVTAPLPTTEGPYTNNYDMENISIYNLTGGTAAAFADPSSVPNGTISTGQGFGFKALQAGTIEFNNSMRRTSGNTTLRTLDETQKDRIWLSIKNTTNQLHSSTLIGFFENTTNQFDQGYDSDRMATIVSLYSHMDNDDKGYSIQAKEAFNEQIEVSLGFSTLIPDNETYTISLHHMEGIELEGVVAFIKDNVTGTITNLNETPYTFNSEASIQNNRFTLFFKNRNILDQQELTLQDINVSPNPTDGIINITSPDVIIKSIEIKDVLGKSLIIYDTTASQSQTIDITNLQTAMYFITIRTDYGSITKRIVKK